MTSLLKPVPYADYKKEFDLLVKLGNNGYLDKVFKEFPFDGEEEDVYIYRVVGKFLCTVQYHKGEYHKPNVFVVLPGTGRCLFYKPLLNKRIEAVDVLELSRQCCYIGAPALEMKCNFDGEEYFVYGEITDTLDLDFSTEIAYSIANGDYLKKLTRFYGSNIDPNFTILDFYLKERLAGKLKFGRLNHLYPLKGNKYVKDKGMLKEGRNLLFIDADTFLNCRYASSINFFLQQCIHQIGKAVAFLHSKDIVLLDLKSENILPSVDRCGKIHVKLIDLEGCVKVGNDVGHLTFVPPEICNAIPKDAKIAYANSNCSQEGFEQLMNSLDFTAASKSMDVWLFGILIFRLFISESMIDEYNNAMLMNTQNCDLLYNKISKELEEIDLNSIPPFFARLLGLIESCLRSDPLKRPSMREIVEDDFFKMVEFTHESFRTKVYKEFIREYTKQKFTLLGQRIYFDPRANPEFIYKDSPKRKRKSATEFKRPKKKKKLNEDVVINEMEKNDNKDESELIESFDSLVNGEFLDYHNSESLGLGGVDFQTNGGFYDVDDDIDSEFDKELELLKNDDLDKLMMPFNL